MNKNQILRCFVYLIFCALIIIIGVALTYYLYTIDDMKYDWKFEEEEFTENSEDCFETENGSFIGGLFFKFSAAFIAGRILSDKYFIKIGTI